jgi:Thioesterase superfamily
MSLRDVLDRIRLADLPSQECREVTNLLTQAAQLAQRHPGTIGTEPTSRRPDLPGRGNALIPGFVMNDEEDGRSYGRGTFSAAHTGRAAAHGGSITLIFDEVMGRLIERDGLQARTAYLHVNFRNLVPIDVPLDIDTRIDRREGRKTYASARIHHGDMLLADAEGLWVSPRED